MSTPRSRRTVTDPPGSTRSTSLVAWTALLTSVLAMVAATTGLAGASGRGSGKKGAGGKVVHLDRTGHIPARYIPTVSNANKANNANNAKRVGGQTVQDLTPSCPPTTVDLGTWCMMSAPYPLTNDQLGKNDYFFATQACETQGGYLPTAGQLIGAANRVKLESVIHDSPLTATVALDPSQGLKDQREMSSTLVTTAAGSDAAGSEGVSDGSTGNPRTNEPNPTPAPADPEPETLQYVTVYDNYNHGGFAGSEAVSKPENFRCAFNKIPGAANQGNG